MQDAYELKRQADEIQSFIGRTKAQLRNCKLSIEARLELKGQIAMARQKVAELEREIREAV